MWGCSRWPTAKVAEAVAIARAEGLVAPQISQGPYSILGRDDGALRPWPHAHPPEGNGRRRVEVAVGEDAVHAALRFVYHVRAINPDAVSYTHLTLPTTPYV